MRASLSQVENIYDLTSDDDKPLREIHRRSQKAFNLNDAQALKVINENVKKFEFMKIKLFI
jgi:hypothetical protein